MSTTTARSPEVGASAGDTDVAAVVAVVAFAAVATSCCGPVATAAPHGGSPVAATLSAARGALNERRLVGTDVSDLSALAGSRAGTIGVTLSRRILLSFRHATRSCSRRCAAWVAARARGIDKSDRAASAITLC
jgi:hypothetical protein